MRHTSAVNAQRVHAALKSKTEAAHRALEDAMALLGPCASVERYRAYLRTLGAFHDALEPELLRDPELRALLPDLDHRTRAAAAHHDLSALGDDGPLPVPSALPPMDSAAARLGVLYVLEGSTLGGQVLQRGLRERLGLDDGALQYVGGYGAETGPRWKRLIEALEGALREPTALARAGEAAAQTFSSLQQRFEAEVRGVKA